jgi:hypothetical protein
MHTENVTSRLPLLLAAVALATAIITAIALWIWLPTAGADPERSATARSNGSSTQDQQPTEPRDAITTASAALTDYLAITDAITADGGANAERIADFVTPGYFPVVLEEFAMYSDLGLRTSGATAFDNLVLEEMTDYSDGSAYISVSYCLDRSGQMIIDDSLTVTHDVPEFRDHFIVDFEVPAEPEQQTQLSYSSYASNSFLCPSDPAAVG